MCGSVPRIVIDPAWPDAALDTVADLLVAARCPVLGPNLPVVPLAFTQGGKAVTVIWQCGWLVAKPITPDLFAIDIVQHVCRPVRMPAKLPDDDSLLYASGDELLSYGVPCAFPLTFARAFLASRRVDWLPMLTDHRTTWRPAARLTIEWNLFADRIVEVAAPSSTGMPAPGSTGVAAPGSTGVAAPGSTGVAAPSSTEVAPVPTAAAPVSTKMALPVPTAQPPQPADAPQLTLPPLAGGD